MRLFFLMFLAVYGSMHAYALRKLWLAFPDRTGLRIGAGVFMLFMVAAPMGVRWCGRAGAYVPAAMLGYVGYVWMAVILWFCVFSPSMDAWNLSLKAAAHWRPGISSWAVAPRLHLWITAGIIAVGLVWGSIEARSLRTPRVVVRTPHLAPGSPPITIAFVADQHLGVMSGKGQARRTIEAIESIRPDVILFGGDLVDAPLDRLAPLVRRLAALRAPLGKYGIFGNHEFYSGGAVSEAVYRAAGIRLLRGESVLAGGRLWIIGVDDAQGRSFDPAARINELPLLPPTGARAPAVLLKHRPKVRREAVGRFDVQISGHTHGGQIFPFYAVVRMFFDLGPGLHDLGEGSRLYVSRGTGTWGPPLRVLAPPEVTAITLLPE